MKTIIDGVEYTDEVPTEPGAYWWRLNQVGARQPMEVRIAMGIPWSLTHLFDLGTSARNRAGLWCRLAPAAEVERLNAEVADVRRTLLSLLVLDLGYRSEPEYGRVPIRNVCTWETATKRMTPGEIAALVAELVKNQQKEITFTESGPGAADELNQVKVENRLLRVEVEKAYREGYDNGTFPRGNNGFPASRAKRVMEGKE
jgi:hypothetical protein